MPPAKARKQAAPRRRAQPIPPEKKKRKKKKHSSRSNAQKIWLAQLSGEQEHKEQQKAHRKEMELMASVLALKDQWTKDVRPLLGLGLEDSPFWNAIKPEAAQARAHVLKFQ